MSLMPNLPGFLPHPMHYYLSSSEQMKQHYAAVANNPNPVSMFSIDNILAPRPLMPARSSPSYYPHGLHPATAFHPASAAVAAHSADIMQAYQAMFPSYFAAHMNSMHGLSNATQNGQKRKRRHRTIFTEEQLEQLEETFNKTHYPDVLLREELAMKVDLKEERVELPVKSRNATSDRIAIQLWMASSRGSSVPQKKVLKVADVIRAGDQQYRQNDSVFVVWGNETGIRRRWYAAYVVGHVKNKSLRIKWGEGGGEEVVDPNVVMRARHVLKPDTKVHVHDPEVHVNDFYQEVCVIRGIGHGRYEVRGRRGRVFSASFQEMMLDNMTVEIQIRKRKGIPLPPTWMQDYPDVWFNTPDKFLSDHVFIFTTPPSSRKFALFDAEDWEKAREALMKIIPRRGGRVVQKMEEMLDVQSPRFRFLLSPVPCRTAKYLQALAANIPCIFPRWVFKMSQQERYFDDFDRYRLPTTASADLETKVEVPWVERTLLFDNLRVGLIGADEFISTWTLAITMGLGFPAPVLDLDDSCFDMENFDIIVVRGTISGSLRAEFAENHVPVVNEEWLVQSLIYGRKQDAHDKRFACSIRKENGRKRSLESDAPDRMTSTTSWEDRYRALCP